MSNIQQQIEKNIAKTLDELPVRADPEEMAMYIDAVVCSGVMKMDIILSSGDTSTDNRIKAFNAVVGAGRYMEQRRLNLQEAEDELLDDMGGLGGETAED